MKKTLVYALAALGHIIGIGLLFLFSGEEEEKAISKIAQPKVVKVEETRNQKQPKAIVQNPRQSSQSNRPEKQAFVNHIVQSGDYLSTIARKYKTSVHKIKVENNLTNDRIYVGQKLTIPQN